jgi:heptosyltransferase III
VRILVIFPGALGDLICLVPTLEALARRHRGASLELMARSELAEFAVRRTAVTRGHSIDRREMSELFNGETSRSEEARRFFGEFIRVHSFFAADNHAYREALSEVCRAEVSFHPFRPTADGHVAAAYLRSIGEETARLEADITLLPEDLAAARRRLQAEGLEPRNFALLFPGSGSPKKNWPPQRFATLAAMLPRKVAVALGPAERGLEPFFARSGAALIREPELGELAAIAAQCSFFIGNDSGVSHLAAASGARGVAIFGPTDPVRWRPLGAVRAIRRVPLDSLAVEEVLAEAEAAKAGSENRAKRAVTDSRWGLS